MRDAVIVSGVRTPTGKFLGGLKKFTAPQLGALAIREAVQRAGIDPESVNECIMGNVVSAGLGQAPARQAAIHGGLGEHVAALTINKVCGSGLKAVMLGAQAIAVSDCDIVITGGMESMSNCPYLLRRAREGFRLGHGEVLDSMTLDGLWCTFEDCHMGHTGEVIASELHISREAQDAYAAESHRRADTATANGLFQTEIVPVSSPATRKGEKTVIDRDESIRSDTSQNKLAALKPAFKNDGTVTAGNAPPVNDGASALVIMAATRATQLQLKPLARIVGQATSGLAPKYVLMTPVDAVNRLLKKIDWKIDDVDLFELNEAFAVQALAVIRELQLDPDKVNVNGGAIALGHAIGSSGARILITLLHALEQKGVSRGIATLCLGGGNGVAVAIERL